MDDNINNVYGTAAAAMNTDDDYVVNYYSHPQRSSSNHQQQHQYYHNNDYDDNGFDNIDDHPWRQAEEGASSFLPKLGRGLYRLVFGSNSSNNNNNNWGIILAVLVVCVSFQWQSLSIWAIWYKIREDGVLLTVMDGLYAAFNTLQGYYHMAMELIRSVQQSLGLDMFIGNGGGGGGGMGGVMGMATTTTTATTHHHHHNANANRNNNNNRRPPDESTTAVNGVRSSGGGAFGGFFGQFASSYDNNEEPLPPLVIWVPASASSSSSSTKEEEGYWMVEEDDDGDRGMNGVYSSSSWLNTTTSATTTSSASPYSSPVPIEPAFLNEEDYPPGWLVYHSLLGVVPKEEADAYDHRKKQLFQQSIGAATTRNGNCPIVSSSNGDDDSKNRHTSITTTVVPEEESNDQQQQLSQDRQSSNSNSNDAASNNSHETAAVDDDDDEGPVWDPEQQIYVGGTVPGATNEQVQAMIQHAGGVLRVFGYGSLCWNPGSTTESALGNASVQACKGHAPHYRRIWGQRSTDHRGVPSFPGVVCTLLNEEELQRIGRSDSSTPVGESPPNAAAAAAVEGMIYTVPPELVERCLEELDFREKGGYAREIMEVVEDESEQTVQALLYRGTADNPAFSRKLATDLRYAAAVMAVSHGPSGPNFVYLKQLYDFLQQAKREQEQHHHQYNTNDDTFALTDLATALRQHSNLYFFCGAGSNQHVQLLNYLREDHDFASLTESFVACQKDGDIAAIPKHLYCGGGHSGLLTENGKLYLWGWNEHGQCGDTHCSYVTVNGDASITPTPLLQPLPILVESASLGFSHTLIIEKDTGRLLALGDDSHGQVTGRKVDTATIAGAVGIAKPALPSVVSTNHRFIAVSAGLFHSAAITSDGALVTFGSGKKGQCLQQDGNNHTWKPLDCKFVSVACGRHHTAILDDRGRVWTMGENKFGQLGRVKTSESTKDVHPIPELIDGPFGKDQQDTDSSNTIHQCVELQSGWSHLVARVESQSSDESSPSHAVFGWGRSDKGQLGMSKKMVPSPERIDSFLAKSRSSSVVASMACGSDSTHFLVRGAATDSNSTNNNDCSIYSVGWNEHGNLGVGAATENSDSADDHDVLTPQKVHGMSRVVSPAACENSQERLPLVAAGGAHMLVMKG